MCRLFQPRHKKNTSLRSIDFIKFEYPIRIETGNISGTIDHCIAFAAKIREFSPGIVPV